MERPTNNGAEKRELHSLSTSNIEEKIRIFDHSSTTTEPNEMIGVDMEQPVGLAKMEAVTVVWTKNWLIAAYVAYVSSLESVLSQHGRLEWRVLADED